MIDGCGGESISYAPWETEVPNNIDEWNRIVDAANPITEAWNAFVISTEAVVEYEQAIGNADVAAAASNLIVAVDTYAPTLNDANSPDAKFGALAGFHYAFAMTAKELAAKTLAATNSDADAWNASIDLWDAVGTASDNIDAESAHACEYWSSVSD